MKRYHSATELGYVHYPIKKDYEVPQTYAPTGKVFNPRKHIHQSP